MPGFVYTGQVEFEISTSEPLVCACVVRLRLFAIGNMVS